MRSEPRSFRRVTVGTLLLLVPLVPLTAFGVARASAPVSILGVVLDEPWTYALLAAAVVLAGAVLMALPPFERWAARALFGMRAPSPAEEAALEPALRRSCAAAGISRERLILRIEDLDAPNASATAARLVCVTTGALRLPERELEAVLAHELGHHSQLHPWVSAFTWWLQLPAIPLRALFRFMRTLIARSAAQRGRIARALGVVALVVLWVIAFQLLWLVWVADVLAAAISRRTEYDADAAAVRWGYGPALLDAYTVLAAGETPKSRLERLTALHPPMAERMRRIANAEPAHVPAAPA